MVKCSRCGVEVDDFWKTCPNCGNDLEKSSDSSPPANETDKCPSCGNQINPGETFCSGCGTEIKSDKSDVCENCGSEIAENVIFCPTCGTKVEKKQNPDFKICRNCGFKLKEDEVFCPECGANVKTGMTNPVNLPAENQVMQNQSFMDKVNLNSILKPTIIAVIVSLVLSSIGLLVGLSWISYILAIILCCGFIGGLIDNDANAILFGLFTGLILGILENPLVQFWYGAFAAGFYEGFFGGQLLLLVILGIISAYVSNMFLKETVQNIVARFKDML